MFAWHGLVAADSLPPPDRVTPAAAGMNSAMADDIAALVAAAIERGEMPGCVVLIGRRSGIVFERAYGNRSFEPAVEPMTTDTLFDMASITKPVATATSVMLLVERGQLRLQDKVARFFPEFAAHGKADITVEQLLTHVSGLIPDNSLDDYHDGWTSAAPLICDLEPIAEPGSLFKYSDVGFILLGKIIECVSGKPVDQFAKVEVFAKLGMEETGYLPPEVLQARAAPTEQRDDRWLLGEVHDPRAARMGGVAGHAGLFSTAADLARYAEMMLGDGQYRGVRILSAATVAEMTRPRDTGGQRRGLGWDMRSAYSRSRGELMTDRAFGHGGFTGTVMWIDPGLDLYVIFLSNRLHPDGVGEVNDLAGRIGSIACAAIEPPAPLATDDARLDAAVARSVRLGVDVLADDGYRALDGKRVGLITNHTGRDQFGNATSLQLHQAANVNLVALFSPEHGIAGSLDTERIDDTVDDETGVSVYSLYGEHRKPTPEQLASIDVLVFDIQDIGTRFYTYISTMGLAMEAAAEAGKPFIVLDRPNPINGRMLEGPLLDSGRESFVGYHPIPVRHGMTIGELARMFAAERRLELDLTVVPVQGWRRGDYWHDTGLRWVNPSPNMRSATAAVLYPGIGLLETTNLSVGRGTDTPFEVMGAPWIRERELAEHVNRAAPPGVRAVPIRFTPSSSKFSGEECGGLNFVITDWGRFRSFELGLVVAHGLRKLHRDDWQADRYLRLLGNEQVLRRVLDGDDVASILQSLEEPLVQFGERRKPFELYR